MPTYRGIIHGRTIELSADPGMADGQQVTVEVEPSASPAVTPAPAPAQPGVGIRRTAGALSDDAAWDDIMLRISAGRRAERPLVEWSP